MTSQSRDNTKGVLPIEAGKSDKLGYLRRRVGADESDRKGELLSSKQAQASERAR